MWDLLREFRVHGAHFRRETPVGPFIADFAWLSAKIIVEVDGDSHETAAARQHDRTRDAFLQDEGFKVLRFDNSELVDSIDHVHARLMTVLEPHLKTTAVHPDGSRSAATGKLSQ